MPKQEMGSIDELESCRPVTNLRYPLSGSVAELSERREAVVYEANL